jgi:hypothetical protein
MKGYGLRHPLERCSPGSGLIAVYIRWRTGSVAPPILPHDFGPAFSLFA